ncbi:hypothetical protein, partial [Archangium sp.]|uniref:SWIM zinc finger family protein n=1 Tax=Archangium sp. TaxID=1872627 RepID=UPI002EDB4C81
MSKTRPEKSPPPSGKWLRRWLTRPRLLELAGAWVYDKGQGMMGRGRVLSWVATPETVRGEVLGRNRVHLPVALSADERGLLGECQCPRFRESNICEHVVALGLAVLAVTSPEEGLSPPPASDA